MARLEVKQINGKAYYYCTEWVWINGKSKRLWQKYLGKLEDIVAAVEGTGPSPLYAEVFQWGLPTALWNECRKADIIKTIDSACRKREQGLSTGEYLVIAAINRAMCPTSKNSMWDWFSKTTLLRCFPHTSSKSLASQRFWDHMARIDSRKARSIWQAILKGVVEREDIDLSSISYDGTNFYTFIDTFNDSCEIAKRGKNKQGRNNLRQISYALFCCADGHTPLFYDVYEGNCNDSKQFKQVLGSFHKFFREITGKLKVPETTIIFDKGNNSPDNFEILDEMKVHFVGSVKLGEHKELARISNKDHRFICCSSGSLGGTKAFRVSKEVYGCQRTLVVTYNQNLFNTQWKTLQNDISKATEALSSLRQRLSDRTKGIITRGKHPTENSVIKQCNKATHRPYLKSIIDISITSDSNGIPRLEYGINTNAHQKVADTYLGKNILITSREEWNDTQIIEAYRSQFIIEGVFKEMKDRNTGNWWPLYHWTDANIQVHGLYCSIAVLLKSLMLRRVQQAGMNLSMKRLLSSLDNIREVVNIYSRKGRRKTNPNQTVLTKRSSLQNHLMEILELDKEEIRVLG